MFQPWNLVSRLDSFNHELQNHDCVMQSWKSNVICNDNLQRKYVTIVYSLILNKSNVYILNFFSIIISFWYYSNINFQYITYLLKLSTKLNSDYNIAVPEYFIPIKNAFPTFSLKRSFRVLDTNFLVDANIISELSY